MKKLNLSLLIILVFISIIEFTSCKDLEVEHQHKFSEKWEMDEYYHWKKCSCGEIVFEATHSFGDWQIAKEPTEEAKGKQERKCTVCPYTVTEEIEKLAHTHKFSEVWTSDESGHWHVATCEHTEEVSDKIAHIFGDWTVTQEATEEVEGTRERSCSVCGYTVTEEIEKLAHTHKFSDSWTYDSTYHWKSVTCEHIEVIGEKEEHSFDGIACTLCDYKIVGFVYVPGVTITGTETWTPESNIFVSGRKLTIPDLIVSDHEVTICEYREVVEVFPVQSQVYDKYGKDGDKNNGPVHCVRWYDTIVYCNKLSIKENLTPCYTINGSTNPDEWGHPPTYRNDTTWDAVTCNFEVDGYRLPTEAEWEWLARGGEEYTYAGSNTLNDVAWSWDPDNPDECIGVREVKTKAANGYGLYDMSGNVYEWCWDWRESIRETTPADGSSTFRDARCFRGGSWDSIDIAATVFKRMGDSSLYEIKNNRGFRVVRTSPN